MYTIFTLLRHLTNLYGLWLPLLMVQTLLSEGERCLSRHWLHELTFYGSNFHILMTITLPSNLLSMRMKQTTITKTQITSFQVPHDENSLDLNLSLYLHNISSS